MGREHISEEILAKIDNSTEGYFLNELPVGTRLIVQTRNTKYDVEIKDGIWIKGHHLYCPDWTKVDFRGSTWGTSILKLHWVGLEMHMEFWLPEFGTVTTSAVESIIKR